MAAFALAFLAGVLSTLSPCVLPLLPIVLGAAGSEHRLGPAALAAGLTLSFAAIGLFVAALGFAIGLDAGAFQIAAAVLMIAIGMVLIVPGFQARLALAGGPAAGAGAAVHLTVISQPRARRLQLCGTTDSPSSILMRICRSRARGMTRLAGRPRARFLA